MNFNEPTQKQINAIINMREALGFNEDEIPKTRMECSKLIGNLKNIIRENLSVFGVIKPTSIHLDDGICEDGYNIFGDDQCLGS